MRHRSKFPDLVTLGFAAQDVTMLRRAKTPEKIQDLIDRIPANFEVDGETCTGVLETLRRRKAHCMEGALVAALLLWMHGDPPLIIDIKADGKDSDHVIAVFRRHGRWGAISKTNRGVLRYRDPVYKNLRELAMSYFHEYFDDKKRKTLRAYSRPLDLARVDPSEWITCTEAWHLAERIDGLRHYRIMTSAMARTLREPTPTEKRSWDVEEYPRPRKKKAGT